VLGGVITTLLSWRVAFLEFLQGVRGDTALEAGIAFLPMTGINLMVATALAVVLSTQRGILPARAITAPLAGEPNTPSRTLHERITS
jgi:hypothetical protein